jgi:hypothetical protein
MGDGIDAMEVVTVAMVKEDEHWVVGILCRLCSSWHDRGLVDTVVTLVSWSSRW